MNFHLRSLESPRWLMKKGRYSEAFDSFRRIRNTELIAARELVLYTFLHLHNVSLTIDL